MGPPKFIGGNGGDFLTHAMNFEASMGPPKFIGGNSLLHKDLLVL